MTNANFAAFLAAQEPVYNRVLRELAAGRKQSHWMWFIFPQIAGLGSSEMAQKFALHSVAEACDYLAHPILGVRLRECVALMLSHAGQDVRSILGYPDDLKFRSCLTLLAAAAPDEPLFGKALDAFYRGQPDARTLELIAE